MAWWNRSRSGSVEGIPAEDPISELKAHAGRIADTDREAASRLLRRPADHDDMPGRKLDRDAWIGRQVDTAFRTRVARTVYRFDDALEDAIHTHLHTPSRISSLLEGHEDIHTRNDREALIICARYAALARGGVPSLTRIDSEVEILAALHDDAVAARLHGTPPARMDMPPTDMSHRRHWLREMLAGEAAAISTGSMTPQHVAHAAVHARFAVVHDRPADGSPIEVRFPAYHPDEDRTAQRLSQAEAMAALDDHRLMARFGVIPGCDTPPSERVRRVSWIRRALTAEAVRRAAGLDAQSGPLALDLVDIDTTITGETLSFSGQLVLSGERICRITSPGNGEISADQWSEGCGPGDLQALDMILSATGDPRDDGATPDSLAARLMDRIALHLALESYREAAAGAVIFTIEENGLQVLLSVPIPANGTRDGARVAMTSAHPTAVALDDMPDDDAALLWAAIA